VAHGHDVHFLERLERLSTPETELALSLYQDPLLIRSLLEEIRLLPTSTSIAHEISCEHKTQDYGGGLCVISALVLRAISSTALWSRSAFASWYGDPGSPLSCLVARDRSEC
jgi:hypothetical protein